MRNINHLGHQVPYLDRLNYFYGQLLSAEDMRVEQAYFREKQKLHNRCLHGFGVVCGLGVSPGPHLPPFCDTTADLEYRKLVEEINALSARIETLTFRLKTETDQGAIGRLKIEIELSQKLLEEKTAQLAQLEASKPPASPERFSTCLEIADGMGIDPEGNELLVRQPLKFDLWTALSREDRQAIQDAVSLGKTLPIYISLCFTVQPVEPVRPVISDSCGAPSSCEHARLRDAVCVVVSITAPSEPIICDPCCRPEKITERCLLLARLDEYQPGEPISENQIHNEVRRTLSLYPLTTIKGISWSHGAIYTFEEVQDILGTNDETRRLEVRFSKKVHTQTLRPGVVEIMRYQGGLGNHGFLNFVDLKIDLPEQPSRLTDSVRFRQTDGEKMNKGDMIVITIKTPFILDECCRPVDGLHVGGQVPIIEEYKAFERNELTVCSGPPGRFGSWTSGNGSGTGVFESWFFCEEYPYRSENDR